tara:strand:- start:137 stop:556 length:420 start_codon:yes stop_codon:yes gene_type:complete
LIKKITNKDKKDWKKFLDSNNKLENKDIIFNKVNKNETVRSIDLHGNTLEGANKVISNFIKKCYFDNVSSINVITGKGSRSKNKEDPYLSKDLSILKYSVPDFIKNNSELMEKIKKLDIDSVNNPNQGTFTILLKKFTK